MLETAKELPGRDEVESTASRLRGRITRTPLVRSHPLGDLTGLDVHLKCENLQLGGSFKIRGALNSCLRAVEEGKLGPGGVITYSSGNHGQAVAIAARRVGCRATIVVPEDIPPIKERAIAQNGARIVPCGRTSIERQERAESIAAETDALIIPPFDHPHTIAGQGTVGLEILEDLPEVDAILVPVGGGGLLAGVAVAAAGRARVIGVEPETANAMFLSLREGRKVTLDSPPQTVADGLRPVAPGDLPLRAALRWVEKVVLVGDREILAAARLLLEQAKLLVEPSGAATTAALLAHRDKLGARRVAVILSGGNVALPDGWP